MTLIQDIPYQMVQKNYNIIYNFYLVKNVHS